LSTATRYIRLPSVLSPSAALVDINRYFNDALAFVRSCNNCSLPLLFVVLVVDVVDSTMAISLSYPLHWLQMIYPDLMLVACILWHLNAAINLVFVVI
jgi:hypothetical protein